MDCLTNDKFLISKGLKVQEETNALTILTIFYSIQQKKQELTLARSCVETTVCHSVVPD